MSLPSLFCLSCRRGSLGHQANRTHPSGDYPFTSPFTALRILRASISPVPASLMSNFMHAHAPGKCTYRPLSLAARPRAKFRLIYLNKLTFRWHINFLSLDQSCDPPNVNHTLRSTHRSIPPSIQPQKAQTWLRSPLPPFRTLVSCPNLQLKAGESVTAASSRS